MSILTEADIKTMTETDLYAALSLIEAEIKQREEGGFAEAVQDFLRTQANAELVADIAQGGGAVRLTFGVDHWDDGYFYDQHDGVLQLRDGTTVAVDVSLTDVHDALIELSQICRREYGLDRDSVLVVDLLTGGVQHDSRP